MGFVRANGAAADLAGRVLLCPLCIPDFGWLFVLSDLAIQSAYADCRDSIRLFHRLRRWLYFYSLHHWRIRRPSCFCSIDVVIRKTVPMASHANSYEVLLDADSYAGNTVRHCIPCGETGG